MPDFSATRLQITGRSDVIIPPGMSTFNGSKVMGGGVVAAPPDPEPSRLNSMVGWLAAVEHKPLYFFILLLIICMAALFFYFRAQVTSNKC